MESSLAAEQGIAQMVVAARRARPAAVPERSAVRLADLGGAAEGAVREVGARCVEQVSAKRALPVSDELGTRLEARQAAQPAPAEGGEDDGAPRRVDVGMDGVFSCTAERDEQQAPLGREAKAGD